MNILIRSTRLLLIAVSLVLAIILVINDYRIIPWPICLLFILILLPVTGLAQRILAKWIPRFIAASEPYITGGMFILRLQVLLVFTLVMIEDGRRVVHILSDGVSNIIPRDMTAELEKAVDEDRLGEVESQLKEIENSKHRADSARIVARNVRRGFELVNTQWREKSCGERFRKLEKRLAFLDGGHWLAVKPGGVQ